MQAQCTCGTCDKKAAVCMRVNKMRSVIAKTEKLWHQRTLHQSEGRRESVPLSRAGRASSPKWDPRRWVQGYWTCDGGAAVRERVAVPGPCTQDWIGYRVIEGHSSGWGTGREGGERMRTVKTYRRGVIA